VAEKSQWERERVNKYCDVRQWPIDTRESGIVDAGDGLFATKGFTSATYICHWEGTPVHASAQNDKHCTPSLRPSTAIMDPKTGNILCEDEMRLLVQDQPSGLPGVLAYIDTGLLLSEGTQRVFLRTPPRSLYATGAGLNLVLDPSGKINPAAKGTYA
jgi:hypothetical protein